MRVAGKTGDTLEWELVAHYHSRHAGVSGLLDQVGERAEPP